MLANQLRSNLRSVGLKSPFSLVSQKVAIKTLRAVAITVARATPMTFIPQPTTNNTFSITLTAPDIISAIRGLLLSPRERNIAASAELNSCCTILVSMMGSANWTIFRVSGPFSMSMLFFNFYSPLSFRLK